MKYSFNHNYILSFRKKKSRSPFEEFEIDVGSPFMASYTLIIIFYDSN